MNPSSTSKIIPTNGLFHMRNYSSDSCWLAYQVSLNQVRLIKYNKNLSIGEGFVFQFAPEPIKQIKLIADQKQNKVYLAVLYLTKYVIYQGNTQLCSHRLKLDRNIVVFENGFVACDAINDQKQIYFTFLTAKGQVHIVPVDNIQKKSIVNINGADSRYCSLKVLNTNVIVGNQKGQIYLVDLNKATTLKSFDTSSNMPILHIGWTQKRVIAITCQGQIFNLNENLTSFTSLSVHQGLINHFNAANNKIYTFGDDCVLNIFQIDKDSNDLKLKKSIKYKKRANMILALYNSTLLNFFESTTLEEISLS